MNRGALKQKLRDVVEVKTDAEGVTKYRCLADVDAERQCSYEQVNFVPGNFKRHLISCHKDVAHRLDLIVEGSGGEQSTAKRPRPSSSSKITAETDRKQVLLGTLLLATEHNLPIRFPQWQGMQMLAGPSWKACGLTITRNTLPTYLARAAEIMRKLMSDLFRNKLVCLKVDSATRQGKSIFGINLTLADDDGNIQIFHLGKYSK